MQQDEEQLYDPTAEEAESARVIDPSNGLENEQNTLDTSGTSETTTPAVASIARRPRWFILEPAVFLIFTAFYLSNSVYLNLILYQTCLQTLHYNESDCAELLGVTRESEKAQQIETQVQPYVSRLIMARSLLESIIPAFVSLFVGPWSDKFGRRPIVLSTFTGYFSGYVILTVLTVISLHTSFTPWLFLLSSVPSVLSGGTCALITGIYCYISDVAKERTRAARMVLNEASLCAGMMVGNIAGSYIYAATNTVTVFSISAALLFLALVYVFFCLPESLKPEQIHTGSKIREFFRFDLVKDLIHTCFERRPNFDRAFIWLTMMSLTVAIFVMEGDSNVTYLFVRKKFGWTLPDYNFFNAGRIIVQIVGSVLGLVVMRKIFKFSIVTMTLLALASCVLESTVRATAVVWWELYFGMILGMMRGILGPMSRAMLSHLAPPTEVGKIMALTTSLESLSPLGAAPLYTIVYNATLQFSAGLFNFISASLYLLCFTMIATIYGIQKSLGQTEAYRAIGT